MRGVVEDRYGARVPCTRVTLELSSTLETRATVCDGDGEFRINELQPGAYHVSVASTGFAMATATVRVAVSSIQVVTVTMQPEGAHESVNVPGFASSVTTQPEDATSQVHQGIVTRQDLENFPLAQRSFANIAYLTPGTEPVEPSDPTKARITAVSTGGSSGLNNELSVDGLDNSDDYIGGFLQNFSTDSIEEFSVRTAQEDADTGGTTAGSVVIVTRRGGDAWHGTAAVYERTAALNARYAIENPAPEPKQPYTRQDYAEAAGGPILARKLWIFESLEFTREDATVAYGPATITQFNALADLAKEGSISGINSIAVPADVPIPFRDSSQSLRFDWSQSEKSSWLIRASGDRYSTHNNLVQQATLPSTGLLTRNNYWNIAIGNRFLFDSRWLGNLILGASGLRLSQTRNSDLGFALAFPFSSTALTVSGFETFGDNQFATPITYFPSLRNQEKYQVRYDVSHEAGHHAIKFGLNFIHEPVLSGSFPNNEETLYTLPQNPTWYLQNPSQFSVDLQSGETTSKLGGSFIQNVQRMGAYVQDSWDAARHLTLNYGLRYSTTFGLLDASGRTQAVNPAFRTLDALAIPLATHAPADDRKQYSPRFGFAYSPGQSGRSLIRGGLGLYFNDLAQNGWATAFQAVNAPSDPCTNPLGRLGTPDNAGCIPGHDLGGTGNLIASNYETPYALHVTAGIQRAFGQNGALSMDFIHEQGNHGYRAYSYEGGINLFTPLLDNTDPRQAEVVPDINNFRSDNRSSYNALLVHLQGDVGHRANLIANYTFSKAQTWGCVLGELFDYVNGVCDPLNAFAQGDYGPSGEDVRHRFVFAGQWRAPGGFEFSTLTQMESARPYTITTADGTNRIAIHGVRTSLDQFRGTPYIQADIRAARSFRFGERWSLAPFVECFNLFNRVNSGANFVTNVSSLPVPADEAQSGNVFDICKDANCATTEPLTNPNELRVPAGALGDFFGPGTTVGIPFAAQVGLRISF